MEKLKNKYSAGVPKKTQTGKEKTSQFYYVNTRHYCSDSLICFSAVESLKMNVHLCIKHQLLAI